MASVMILFLLSMCLAISGEFDFVESMPLLGDKHVVYTRYVRRRPILNSNNYVREVVEVFNTHRRPPPYAFLHYEDLTRFVRCDFDPSMPDCDEETQHSSTTTPAPAPRTSTSNTTTTTTTTASPSTSSFWLSRRSETTTTEQNIKLIENGDELPDQAPAVLQETTSTATSPIDSAEYGDDNSEGENDNEYDDEKNKDTKSTDADDYDEAENAEDNNSEDSTEPNDANDDAEAESEAQTPETTVRATKKPLFNWF